MITLFEQADRRLGVASVDMGLGQTDIAQSEVGIQIDTGLQGPDSGGVVTGDRVQVFRNSARTDSLSGYNVYPAQEPHVGVAGAIDPAFAIDAAIYQQDELYPASFAAFTDLTAFTIAALEALPLRVDVFIVLRIILPPLDYVL